MQIDTPERYICNVVKIEVRIVSEEVLLVLRVR
jgi:hypothetical protein